MKLHQFKVWLPLPLMGLIFWVVGQLITTQMLNRTANTTWQLDANTQVEIQPAGKVLFDSVEPRQEER